MFILYKFLGSFIPNPKQDNTIMKLPLYWLFKNLITNSFLSRLRVFNFVQPRWTRKQDFCICTWKYRDVFNAPKNMFLTFWKVPCFLKYVVSETNWKKYFLKKISRCQNDSKWPLFSWISPRKYFTFLSTLTHTFSLSLSPTHTHTHTLWG